MIFVMFYPQQQTTSSKEQIKSLIQITSDRSVAISHSLNVSAATIKHRPTHITHPLISRELLSRLPRFPFQTIHITNSFYLFLS